MTQLDPLDHELAHLFEAEARFPDEPAERRARVWGRIAAQTALVMPEGGSCGTPSRTSIASASATKLVTIATAAFLAGGVFGASVYHSLRRDPEPLIIEVPAPAPVIEPLTMEQPTSEPIESEPNIAQPTEPSRPARASTREEPTPMARSEIETTESQLARERAVIDVARTAIARGNASSALSAIDRHAAEFPRGQLTEEREGLRIIALVQAGQRDEALRRASQFRSRYPRSLLHSAIESAIRTED